MKSVSFAIYRDGAASNRCIVFEGKSDDESQSRIEPAGMHVDGMQPSRSLCSLARHVTSIWICATSHEFPEPSSLDHDLSRYEMDGYHKLASLVSDHQELLMLRRFSTVNTKNLLYMQAEILHLEAELHDIASEDHSGCEKHRNHEYCVFDLKESYEVRGSDTQWRKILEIREKLKEYSQSTCIGKTTSISSTFAEF